MKITLPAMEISIERGDPFLSPDAKLLFWQNDHGRFKMEGDQVVRLVTLSKEEGEAELAYARTSPKMPILPEVPPGLEP